METIQNAISGATKYVYGENNPESSSGPEPVSGQQGQGTAEDPFDQGNVEGKELNTTHKASSNHGPHPTYAGNLLDPRTSDAAQQKTFGESQNVPVQSVNTSTGGYGNVPGDSATHHGAHHGGSFASSGVGRGSGAGNAGSTGYTSGQTGSTDFTGSSSNTASSGNYGAGDRFDDRSRSGISHETRGSDTLSGSTTSHTTGGGVAAGQPQPQYDTDKTGVVRGIHENDPHGRDIRPTEANENKGYQNTGGIGTADPAVGAEQKSAGGFGTAEPSVGADPRSAQQPTQKHQGADRPKEGPDSQSTGAIKDEKERGEEALKHRDPNDHSGEPMKMHDGHDDTQKERQSNAGQEGGDEHGKEKGSGEQWVKTSGFQAEGGDFDAKKPGAGREADRLLEQKGVHREGAGASNTASHTDNSASQEHHGSSQKKEGLGDKLKHALHKS